MKITIERIAELAGVSRGTVDRVIHNRPGVKESVREEVMQIIRANGYVPPRAKLDKPCKVVAVIMPYLKNPYFAELKREMDRFAKRHTDVTVNYYFCETTDIAGQISILEMASDADAWLIRGVRSKRLQAKLEEIKKPIFFLDAEVPGVTAVCKIGENCYKSGRIAASLMAKSINYSGQVVAIAGAEEIISHRQRLQGFLEAMNSRYPQIKVVKQCFSQDQSAVAYTEACQILDAFPYIKGICNLAGYSGEIGQAILERQRTVRMVCNDSNQDVVRLIEKGVAEFAISLDITYQAKTLIDTIYDYLMFGTKPVSDFIEIPVVLAFDETISSAPLPTEKPHGKGL